MSYNNHTAAMTADQRSKCHAIIHTAAAALASVTAATVGRAVSQVLVGWIPGLGNAINASTAAALTESVGWLLAKEFAGQSWAD